MSTEGLKIKLGDLKESEYLTRAASSYVVWFNKMTRMASSTKGLAAVVKWAFLGNDDVVQEMEDEVVTNSTSVANTQARARNEERKKDRKKFEDAKFMMDGMIQERINTQYLLLLQAKDDFVQASADHEIRAILDFIKLDIVQEEKKPNKIQARMERWNNVEQKDGESFQVYSMRVKYMVKEFAMLNEVKSVAEISLKFISGISGKWKNKEIFRRMAEDKIQQGVSFDDIVSLAESWGDPFDGSNTNFKEPSAAKKDIISSLRKSKEGKGLIKAVKKLDIESNPEIVAALKKLAGKKSPPSKVPKSRANPKPATPGTNPPNKKKWKDKDGIVHEAKFKKGCFECGVAGHIAQNCDKL